MVEAYFDNIQSNIISCLQRARSVVRIAVSWFTDFEIYDILVNAARQGVRVEIILLDDVINESMKIKLSGLSLGIGFVAWLFKGRVLP